MTDTSTAAKFFDNPAFKTNQEEQWMLHVNYNHFYSNIIIVNVHNLFILRFQTKLTLTKDPCFNRIGVWALYYNAWKTHEGVSFQYHQKAHRTAAVIRWKTLAPSSMSCIYIEGLFNGIARRLRRFCFCHQMTNPICWWDGERWDNATYRLLSLWEEVCEASVSYMKPSWV